MRIRGEVNFALHRSTSTELWSWTTDPRRDGDAVARRHRWVSKAAETAIRRRASHLIVFYALHRRHLRLLCCNTFTWLSIPREGCSQSTRKRIAAAQVHDSEAMAGDDEKVSFDPAYALTSRGAEGAGAGSEKPRRKTDIKVSTHMYIHSRLAVYTRLPASGAVETAP